MGTKRYITPGSEPLSITMTGKELLPIFYTVEPGSMAYIEQWAGRSMPKTMFLLEWKE